MQGHENENVYYSVSSHLMEKPVAVLFLSWLSALVPWVGGRNGAGSSVSFLAEGVRTVLSVVTPSCSPTGGIEDEFCKFKAPRGASLGSCTEE